MSSPISGRRVLLARTLAGVCLSAGLLGLFAGCAELITYSKQSQEKGKALYDQGQYEQAVGAFNDSTRQNPANYTGFYYAGLCYEHLGREQQVLQSYRTAIDVLPKKLNPVEDADAITFREQAVTALAGCISRAASRDSEIASLDARAKAGAHPLDWYVLAKTYAATGDADNAIDAYDRATNAMVPPDRLVTKSFGLYLLQVKQTKRAAVVLMNAYKLDPTDADVNAGLRTLGIVPGPSLLDQDQLSKPLIPKGPIPEMELKVKHPAPPAEPQ